MYNFDKKDGEKKSRSAPLFMRKVEKKMEEPMEEETDEVTCPKCGCEFVPGEEYEAE